MNDMKRRTKMEIVRTILNAVTHNRRGISIYGISLETRINALSVKDYINLIEFIQNYPEKILTLRSKTPQGTRIMVGLQDGEEKR